MTAGTNVIVSTTQFSPRVMELRKKIHDTEYVNYAVQRIAQVLSRQLVEEEEHAFVRRRNGAK